MEEKVMAEVMEQRQKDIEKRLSGMESAFDRYDYLISVGCFEGMAGNEMTEGEDRLHRDANLMKTCQSRLWVLSEIREGRLFVKVDSDSMIVRGVAVLLASVLEGASPKEVSKVNIWLLEKLKLEELLPDKRKKGLKEMIFRIKEKCENQKQEDKT